MHLAISRQFDHGRSYRLLFVITTPDEVRWLSAKEKIIAKRGSSKTSWEMEVPRSGSGTNSRSASRTRRSTQFCSTRSSLVFPIVVSPRLALCFM